MRVALVHDRLVSLRGGERVFEEISRCFPEADVYALLVDKEGFRHPLPMAVSRVRDVSPLRFLPSKRRWFKQYFPLFPLAARALRLEQYDLVISSSSAFAHWVRVPRSRHLCYLYTPLRQAWSEADAIMSRLPSVAARAYGLAAAAFRALDREAAAQVDAFATTSTTVQKRVGVAYGREAAVIPPGVDLERFHPVRQPDSYFLCVSALVRYKRVDLAVEACNRTGALLKVVGTGPELASLRRLAGPTVELLGDVSDDEVAHLLASCRAFIFPTIDDYGITCIEAQAAGRPVICVGAGGALDTVRDGVTGRYFAPQSVDALAEVLRSFDPESFDADRICAHAARFSLESFRARFKEWVASSLASAQRERMS